MQSHTTGQIEDAVHEGYAAYRSGQPRTQSPYDSNRLRSAWQQGWDDAEEVASDKLEDTEVFSEIEIASGVGEIDPQGERA